MKNLIVLILSSTCSVFCDLYSDELISLATQSHIVCSTDVIDSALYVYPPTAKGAKNTSILMENDTMWGSDWSLERSTNIFRLPIFDKRWQDLETLYTNNIHFPFVISLSLSTTSTNSTIITSNVVDKKVNRLNANEVLWTDYGVEAKDLSPFQAEAESSKNAYWKVHDYPVRWAVRMSHKPTVLNVGSAGVDCLMLYAYVCANCSMEIEGPGFSDYIMGLGFGTDEEQNWHSVKFAATSSSTVTLNRGKWYDIGTRKGYWGIDIRRCSETTAGREIIEAILEDTKDGLNRTCRIMRNPDSIYSKPTAQNYEYNRSIFNCTAGTLGKACNITCEDLLGATFKTCEKHKICEVKTSQCSCSWGYTGELCETECPDGRWGLDCVNTCHNGDVCDKQTGAPGKGSASLNFNKGTVITLSLIAAIISATLS